MKTRGAIASDALVVGFALFAMFFGAGNVIFPPYLGMSAGTSWLAAFAAFALTDAVLALIAIAAVDRGDGTISGVTRAIGRRPSAVLNFMMMLCVGPLVAIPRTAATTYELAVAPNFSGISLPAVSVIFFLIVFGLTIRPSKVVDIIGKFLTPVLLVDIALLIAAGITSPLGAPAAPTTPTPVTDGIINGYQTLDAIAGLGFGMFIVSTLRSKGYHDGRSRVPVILGASGIACVAMLLVYGGLAYIGATYSSAADINDFTQASLTLRVTRELLGNTGVLLLGVVVLFACLTTAIGLTSAFAAYIGDASGGRVSYGAAVAAICVFSCATSNIGLSLIIKFAVPVLLFVYPAVMTLTAISFVPKGPRVDSAARWATAAALAVSALSIAASYGAPISFIHSLPLAEYELHWLIPTVLMGCVGAALSKGKQG